MKLYPSKINPIVTIVACMHGDELFGLEVINYFKNNLDDFPGLQLVIANEEAIAQQKRFIDVDLNRAFATSSRIHHEERLAAELLRAIQSSTYVLDIHNTTSDILMTPIVTSMNENVKHVFNLCASKEIAFIQKPLSDKSLIGQLSGGVSLEFGFEYAKTNDAIEEVDRIVKGLLSDQSQEKTAREIFCVDGVISKEIDIPKETKNFHLIEKLQVYPFLFGEQSYPTIHAMSASTKYIEVI